MKKALFFAIACVAITVSPGLTSAQQRGQPQSQRRVAPMPPANELHYRTFAASQLGQADQNEPVRPAGRGAPVAIPNTANVIDEIFRLGLGPIVLGLPGQMNADGTERPYVVLSTQGEVFNLVDVRSNKGGADANMRPAAGRRTSPSPSENFTRLQKNLVALKVNMIISGNGITVNDPGEPFRELYLAWDFDVAERPFYDNCFQCWADSCPGTCVMIFGGFGIKCRCIWEYLPPARASDPNIVEGGEPTMPRRLRDLAAYADKMLTYWQDSSETDFDAVNETIEVVNSAFASDLPFGPEDIVEWGGPDGKLVVTSVRPLSEVPFLVTKP